MGFFLIIPFFLIRFGLLSLLNKTAIGRAAYFPPLTRGEKPAYWLYQLSTAAILLLVFFARIVVTPNYLFLSGAAVYLAGNLLLIISMLHFAVPSSTGLNQKGLYGLSRNPMYVAYFVYFLGCALLTQSPALFGAVLVFQSAAHWIILSEERWCVQSFGAEYLRYMKKVRRYL